MEEEPPNIYHHVEPLLRRRRHEVACERFIIRIARLERMLALCIARPQALFADVIGHIEHMQLMRDPGLLDQ